MRKADRETAPSYCRGDGVVSRLLHPSVDGSEGDFETDLTLTWVEVEPGESQDVHSHSQEQMYVVVEGEGVHVDGEESDVSSGDAVHVPSNASHGIENTGEGVLEYVSAATPGIPLDMVEEFYEG
ncbi:MAG: cupin domain-containing protein [Halobacteriota archaeon]